MNQPKELSGAQFIGASGYLPSQIMKNSRIQNFPFFFLATKREIAFSGITQLKNQVFPVHQSEQIKHSSPQRKYVRNFFFLERQFRQIANLLIIYLAEKQEKEERKIIIILFKKSIRLHLVIVLGKNRKKKKKISQNTPSPVHLRHFPSLSLISGNQKEKKTLVAMKSGKIRETTEN